MTILDKLAIKARARAGGDMQKIVNGELAIEGEYPYAAALFDGQFFCGGSLITPSVVLSASHCIVGGGASEVRLGCTDLSSPDCEVIQVVQNILHPNFDPALDVLGGNDLAILVLAEPSVQETAQIPSPNVGQNAFLDLPSFEVGWGNTIPIYNEFEGADFLRDAETLVLDNDVCQNQNDPLFEVAFGVTNTIDDTMICTVGNGRGSCQGDSGGPLAIRCDGEDEDLIIGATSFGLGCAYDGHPNIFARTFNQAGFDFIVSEVANVGELGDLQIVDNLNNFCQDAPVTASPIAPTPFPTQANLDGWICDGFFGSQDGCDCECGIPDPDCQFDQENFFCGGNAANICAPEDECRTTDAPTSSPITSAPTEGNNDGNDDDINIDIEFEVQVAILAVAVICLLAMICCVCCFIVKMKSKDRDVLEQDIHAKELM